MEFVRAATSQIDDTWRKDIIHNGQPLNVLLEVPAGSALAALAQHGAENIFKKSQLKYFTNIICTLIFSFLRKKTCTRGMLR